jgi:hypothetical protein
LGWPGQTASITSIKSHFCYDYSYLNPTAERMRYKLLKFAE